jgi:hypothetical protein
MPNQRTIQEKGLKAFLLQQKERMDFLMEALDRHNDGRSKNVFCLAAALLSIQGLHSALSEARNGGNLRERLLSQAKTEGTELKLRK